VDGVILALNQEFIFTKPSEFQVRKLSGSSTSEAFESDWSESNYINALQYTPVRTIFVPADHLDTSAVYQFRLVVHFQAFDYRSAWCVASTVTREETRVSHFILQNSTSTSLDLSWMQPSVSDGLVGYRLTLSLVVPDNGLDLADAPTWEADRWTVQQTVHVSFGVSSYSFGCNDLGDVCLAANTVHRVELVHVRESRLIDSPAVLFATTAKAVIVGDSAELYLHGATLFVSAAIPHSVTYDSKTDIKETFLHPCTILSSHGAVNVTLSSSTVQSLSTTLVRIRLSEADYRTLANQVYAASAMTPLILSFAGGQPIAINHQCMFVCVLVPTNMTCRSQCRGL
jgi:hypothetical protein